MRLRSTAFLTALAALAFFVAIAAPTNKNTINLVEPMNVGNVTLKAGAYTIEWDGPGPDVQVSFSQGNTTIVTAPAMLQAVQNRHDMSVTCRTQESGTRSLVEIETKNTTLHFAGREE